MMNEARCGATSVSELLTRWRSLSEPVPGGWVAMRRRSSCCRRRRQRREPPAGAGKPDTHRVRSSYVAPIARLAVGCIRSVRRDLYKVWLDGDDERGEMGIVHQREETRRLHGGLQVTELRGTGTFEVLPPFENNELDDISRFPGDPGTAAAARGHAVGHRRCAPGTTVIHPRRGASASVPASPRRSFVTNTRPGRRSTGPTRSPLGSVRR